MEYYSDNMKPSDITPEYLRQNGINPDGLLFGQYHLPYNPRLKNFSREMRFSGEKAEALLWDQLKSRKTGYSFTRQKPILNFIADFYCKKLSLVVEIDGVSHFSREAYDNDCERDRQMQVIGLRVVRVEDEDVRRDAEFVAKSIVGQITELDETPPESPSERGTDFTLNHTS